MKRISVVLSSSTEFRNSGMFSVDYAAYSFLKKTFPECIVEFYVFHLSPENSYPYEQLIPYSTYNKFDETNIVKFYDSDLIVYWSDFFHTRHFLEQYMENYVFKYSKDRTRDIDLFFKAFFLEGASDSVFKKTIGFGNSMMFLDIRENIINDRYSQNLLNLYSKMKLSMPRDRVSFEKLKAIKSEGLMQGCDPAFLINKTRNVNKEKVLGLFLGRRTEIKIRDVFEIVKFAKKNNLKIEWINWMINTESFFIRSLKHPSQAKNLLIHCFLSFVFRGEKPSYENDFTTLGRFSIVVTDTYHLAINSFRETVPVFCIGDDNVLYGRKQLDLHDRKKEILFEMMKNEQCYGKVTESKLDKIISGEIDFITYKKKASKIKSSLVKKIKNIFSN